MKALVCSFYIHRFFDNRLSEANSFLLTAQALSYWLVSSHLEDKKWWNQLLKYFLAVMSLTKFKEHVYLDMFCMFWEKLVSNYRFSRPNLTYALIYNILICRHCNPKCTLILFVLVSYIRRLVAWACIALASLRRRFDSSGGTIANNHFFPNVPHFHSFQLKIIQHRVKCRAKS